MPPERLGYKKSVTLVPDGLAFNGLIELPGPVYS